MMMLTSQLMSNKLTAVYVRKFGLNLNNLETLNSTHILEILSGSFVKLQATFIQNEERIEL